MHRRWLRLSSAGAIRQRGRHSSSDDDDARSVRGNALLVAAGWRATLHVQMPMDGLRDQLKAQAAGKVTIKATATSEPTAMEVQVEVQAHANPSGKVGDSGAGGAGGGSGDDSGLGIGGGDSNRGSGGGDSNSGTGNPLSSEGRLFSGAVRGKTGPVTRRLLTACNTDWRAQPNASDVCKAPTATQVPQNTKATTHHHAQLTSPTRISQICAPARP